MYKVLISANPFGKINSKPVQILKKNKIGIKITSKKNIEKNIQDCDFYIAGTEIVSDKIISKAKKLKFISRVGIGLDNLNLKLLKKKKNKSCIYTRTPIRKCCRIYNWFNFIAYEKY